MAKDWMKFYYADPHPERFVQEVRQWSAEGSLGKGNDSLPTIVFLSCIIASNPECLPAWLDSLRDLPEEDMRSLEMAVWFSGTRTPEAQKFLQEGISNPRFADDPPKILEAKTDNAITLDIFWCYYFATGDLNAVRRIISVFEYMSDFGAAKSFKADSRIDKDIARAMRDAIFQAAIWSLGSLMQEHTPLKDYCYELLMSEDITERERGGLAMVLAKVDPEHWHKNVDPDVDPKDVSSKPAIFPCTDPKRKSRWKLW